MTTNLAVASGTAAYVTGKTGQALTGAMAAASLPSTATFTSGYTWECWAKVTTPGSLRIPMEVGGWIGIAANGTFVFTKYDGSGGPIATTAAIGDNTWHHLAVTVDGTTTRAYVDGVQAGSVVDSALGASGTLSGRIVAVGGLAEAPGSYDWPGQVDLARVSSGLRYTGTFTPPTSYTDDANTIVLYPLDGNLNDIHGVVTTIAANDPNIAYSPYTWDVTATRAKTINAGAYLSCQLTGSASTITATFDVTNMASPPSQVSYRVDSGPWTTVPVAATVALTIPATNTWANHFVELRVKATTETANRWNSPQNTAVAFTGFTTSPNVTTATFRKKRFNILCFGDSITEGVRTLGATQTNDTDRNDSALGWAYPLGALLGADIGVVGFGAMGLTVSGTGNVPALPSSYNLLWAGTTRTFTTTPDLILINAGTNDSADITTAATTFLNGLLAATTTAKIAVVQQWNGATHKTQWQAAITASAAPYRVSYIDTAGWWASADSSDGLHPYGYANVSDLAPRLAAAVGPLLAGGSGRRFINRAGVAVAV